MYRKIFWIINVLLFVIMPVISKDYGQNGDDDVELLYGEEIFNYYAHGDKTALYYPPSLPHRSGHHFYGGLFNLITETVHRIFPSWHIIEVRHFFCSIFGALMMLFTGLLAYRLSGRRWDVGLLALLFIALSPRMFGESMHNAKDIPFAMGCIMSVYFLTKILQDISYGISRKSVLGLTIGWGIAFGVRSSSAFILLGYLCVFILLFILFKKRERIYLFRINKKRLRQLILTLIAAFIGGYCIGLIGWPYGLQNPIRNVLASFTEMSNRGVGLVMLFDGIYIINHNLPWYYVPKWVIYTSPIIVLLLFWLYLPIGFTAYKRHGLYVPLFLIFSIFFPWIYILISKTTLYDTWRHLYFIYPFMTVSAALSFDVLSGLAQVKYRRVLFFALVLSLTPVIIWNVTEHPNQYVYFNKLAGGTKGVLGRMDLDYYVTSGKQSAEWIIKNAPKPEHGKKVIVGTNMEGMEYYFRNDTSWIEPRFVRYYQRSDFEWDYYITYGRFISEWQLQNGKWPPDNAVYVINVGGAPIGAVLKNAGNDSYLAFWALEQGEFENAIALYQNYLHHIQSDEMVYLNYGVALAAVGHYRESIDVIKIAISLNQTQPHSYEMLSKVFRAMGNDEKADKFEDIANQLYEESFRRKKPKQKKSK